jgi:hypothetical protein
MDLYKILLFTFILFIVYIAISKYKKSNNNIFSNIKRTRFNLKPNINRSIVINNKLSDSVNNRDLRTSQPIALSTEPPKQYSDTPLGDKMAIF